MANPEKTTGSIDTVDSIATLATEARNPDSWQLDQLDALGIARLMNQHDATIACQLEAQLPAIALLINALVDRIKQGGRVIFTGAGTSGRLGVLDAAECVPTFQSPPGQIVGLIAGGMGAMFRAVEGAEDSPELAAQDLTALGLDKRDSVIGIAASGRTPYVQGSLTEARRVGALTAAIACVQNSRIGALASHVIEVVTGPEVLMGSTRLRAGTATKLVLNTITTSTMILLGKTMGDLMVDLRASNEKLRLRSVRLVAMGANVDMETAAKALARASGEVKTAIVALKNNSSAVDGRARLRAAQGRVALAINSQPATLAKPTHSVAIGIDGGGTSLKLRFAIRDGDGWNRLPLSSGPPALPATHGSDGTAFEWRRRILGELALIGLNESAVGAVVAGTSGAGNPQVKQELARYLADWFPHAKIEILADVQLLARAAGDKHALCLVAGTGSIAWWEPDNTTIHRAGGFGPGIGDEGSGAWLADEAIRAVCMADDGRGPETSLIQALLIETKQTDARGLAVWRQKAGRTAAGLTRLVLQGATTGDTVAQSLRAKGIYHLRALAQVVLRKGGGNRPKMLVAGGGLFSNDDFWQVFQESFHNSGAEMPVWTRIIHPVDGALAAAEGLFL